MLKDEFFEGEFDTAEGVLLGLLDSDSFGLTVGQRRALEDAIEIVNNAREQFLAEEE